LRVVELVVAGLLLVGAIRSGVRWMGVEYAARGTRDRVLFAVHAGARVGLWVAFAGFFVGYALVDEPQQFKWFFLVPIALAGLQLLTGMLLSRPPSRGV
jgi:hypothetical protein